jgi:nucleotide-binding universal stress UspA family protein
MRPQAELALEPLVAMSPNDVAVSTYIRPGMMGGAPLHDVAIEPDAAAIVVGPSHRGRIGRVLGGDLSTSLLHGAPCRWWSRHPIRRRPDGFRRICFGSSIRSKGGQR